MTSVLQEGENGNQTPLVSVTIPFFNAADESTTVARYFPERYSTILYLEHEGHSKQRCGPLAKSKDWKDTR